VSKTLDKRQGTRLIAFVLAFVALVGFAVLPHFDPGRSRLVGLPAPEFTLPVMIGGEPGSRLSLGSLRGEVVVLDFWASWCAPCRAQAPLIDRVARRMQGKGVSIVGISTSGDDWGRAVRFAQSQDLSYETVFDAEGQVASAFGVDVLPTLVVLDRDGIIRAVRTRSVREDELVDLIEAAK
jgi:cytochrome c biogenesis protein CcmG, thiol:disulfide interchange protein DsbE